MIVLYLFLFGLYSFCGYLWPKSLLRLLFDQRVEELEQEMKKLKKELENEKVRKFYIIKIFSVNMHCWTVLILV